MVGAPGGIRTPDRLVRSQVLYPTELQALFEAAWAAAARHRTLLYDRDAGIKFTVKQPLAESVSTSGKSALTVKVLNATGGCISWRDCLEGEQQKTIEALQKIYKGAEFTFAVSELPPHIPAGGYRPPDPQQRKVRFVKNIT